MALYGWKPYEPPKPDPNAGFVRYHPPKRTPPRRPPHRPTPPVRQHPYDPLAPLSDDVLRQRAMSLSQEQLGPLLDQIRRVFAERSRQGQEAIRGTTQALGNLFAQAAPQTAAAYNPAIQQSQQVNSELANRLSQFGQNLGGELQGKLDLQNAPQNLVGQIAGGAQQTAQGVSNANFATGAADTQRLIAESAHGQEYGAKLPGIAGLTGMQHAKQLEAQLNRDLADQLANASDKAQSTFSDLYLHLVDQEWQKTLARTSGQFKSQQAIADAQYRAQQIAFKKAELAYRQAKAKADRTEKAREANQRAATARKNAQTAAQRAAEQRRHNQQTEAQAKKNKKGKKQSDVGPDGLPKH